MKNEILNNNFALVKRAALTTFAVLFLMTGAVWADDINLNMEGSSSATIPKGNTVTRKIFGIPKFGGTLRLRFKWHAVSLIPNTFNPLKVEVLHGSSALATKTSCYSTHSNKTPKCDTSLTVSQTEAEKSGDWILRVTNNSNDEVIGFDIAKAGDINPLVPNFTSIYTPNCPDTVKLDMEGAGTATITKGGSVTRILYGVGKTAGVLRLKAKWHAVNLKPTYNPLKIELLDPSGTVVASASGNYYSVHAPDSPKYDITYNISAAQAQESGQWRLRVTNNSSFEVLGFNIEKDSGELNPLVPSFSSTYKAACQ